MNDISADKSNRTHGKGSHRDISQDDNNKIALEGKVVDESARDGIATKF